MWQAIPFGILKPVINYLVADGFKDYVESKNTQSSIIGPMKIFKDKIIRVEDFIFSIDIIEGNPAKTGSTDPQVYVRTSKGIILRGCYRKDKFMFLFQT